MRLVLPSRPAAAMADPTRLSARFPAVPATAGHYESFYLKACHPQEPLGVWIRYTVHKRPGAAPDGSLWFTLFDGAAEGPRAPRSRCPDPALATATGSGWASAAIGDGSASGAAGTEAEWDLRFELVRAAALPPAARLDVPRAAAAHEAAQPGPGGALRRPPERRRPPRSAWTAGAAMVGHNWGAEHAERWIWLHGARPRRRRHWLDAAHRAGSRWAADHALDRQRRALDRAASRHALGGPGARRSRCARRPSAASSC